MPNSFGTFVAHSFFNIFRLCLGIVGVLILFITLLPFMKIGGFDLGWWGLAIYWLICASLAYLTYGGWLVARKWEKKIAAASSQSSATPTRGHLGGNTADVDIRQHLKDSNDTADWAMRLTEVCSRYSEPDYYVTELIPSKKLENSLSYYPAPNSGGVIALIDATLFGSAKNGLAVGVHGISWKNGWFPTDWHTMESNKYSFRWHEMRGIPIEKIGFSSIKIGNGSYFSVGACRLKIDVLIKILEEIRTLAISEYGVVSRAPIPRSVITETDLVDVNVANIDDLISLPGIGVAEGQMILNRRASRPFESVDDLADYLGLKPHKAQQLKKRIAFSKSVILSPDTAQNPLPPQNIPNTLPSSAPTQQPGSGRVID